MCPLPTAQPPLEEVGEHRFWVTPQGFLVSLAQVWLPAMKAKGLEISGTFSRQVGSISMDLVLTNKALQVMSDFAIQFNRNR